jgi:hypothetical protein
LFQFSRCCFDLIFKTCTKLFKLQFSIRANVNFDPIWKSFGSWRSSYGDSVDRNNFGCRRGWEKMSDGYKADPHLEGEEGDLDSSEILEDIWTGRWVVRCKCEKLKDVFDGQGRWKEVIGKRREQEWIWLNMLRMLRLRMER